MTDLAAYRLFITGQVICLDAGHAVK